MTFIKIFAKALHTANTKQGQLVSFGPQVPSSLLFELVRELSSLVPEENGQPSAILITTRSVPQSLERNVVASELEAAAFRVEAPESCKRYFLSEGFDLATMYTVAPLLLPAEFPAVSSGEFRLENIASEMTRHIAGQSTEASKVDWDIFEANLNLSLRISAEIFRSGSSNLDIPWNVAWLEFIQEATDALIASVPIKSGASQVEELALTAFGLPASGHPSSWKKDPKTAASEMHRAFESYWSSADEVSKSSEFLRMRFADTQSSRLLYEFDGEQFEIQSALTGQSLISCIRAISRIAVQGIESRPLFPASDFLSPRSKDEKPGSLSVSLSGGEELGFGRTNLVSPFLVGIKESGKSPEVLIRIPMSEEYFGTDQLIGEISISTSLADIDFQPSSVGISDGDLVLIGEFELTQSAVVALDQTCFLAGILSYDLTPDSKLAGYIPSSSRCNMIFTRHWGKDFAVIGDPGSRSMAKLEAWVFDPQPQEVELSNSQKSVSVYVFGADPEFEGLAMESFGQEGGFKFISSVGKRMTVTSGESIINLFTSLELTEHQSPILAAAYKENLSISLPSTGNQLSIRGRLEGLLASEISNESFLLSNFHIAIAESVPLDASALSAEYLPGVVTGLAVAGVLKDIPFEVDSAFVESQEVKAFQQAFRGLGVLDQLENKLDGTSEWPSKVSWRSLYRRREELNAFLETFESMVAASESFGPATKFWASYPFSASIWNIDDQNCSAVLLSPLHPIRLAWLASVEQGLWETAEAQNFIGVIEGWNFPYLGPGIFSGSSMVAIPTDLGDDSLFAGWSMLAPVPGGQPSPLIGPATAATLPAPGSSATGFNASTARSALRAFRKINNHLNDFVIDLGISQTKSSPRLAEVDIAVIAEAEELLSSNDVYGGVHVFDSSKRTGLPPYQRLNEVAMRSYPKPFSWAVYEDGPKVQVRSHVKMLQDPGIKVQISKTGAQPQANMPEVPYRRFVGVPSQQSVSVGETLLLPKVNLQVSTWQEFATALSALEGLAYGDQISASLQLSAIVGGDSDWTVSGEGMIDPSAIMSLLSSSHTKDSMLWEWRPPFLNKKSLSQELSRRPYFAIARIPSSFRSQIANKVRKALPAETEDSDRIASRALTVLGGRGMGLSSLLSMGTTHTTGALGFYAAFDLLDQVTLPSDHGLIVLPVDACEPFIETLSGMKSLHPSKRADLIAIVFSEDSATFLPIEVKLYGLDAQASVSPTLPSPESGALDEAKLQAANTSNSLQRVVEQSKTHLSNHGQIESLLWRTNLAALFDAGAKLTKLSRENSRTLSKLMGRVLSGLADIQVGGSLITYFHAASSDGAGNSWLARNLKSDVHEKPESVLVCSIGLALSSAGQKEQMFQDWNELFAFATLQVGSNLEESEVLPVSNVQESSDEGDTEETEADSVETYDLGRDVDNVRGSDESTQDADRQEVTEKETPPPSEDSSQGYVSKLGLGRGSKEIYWRPSSLQQGIMMGVIGKPGMGKTQLVLSIMQDFSELNNSDGSSAAMFVFDFKGEFSVMEDFNELYGFSVVNVTEPVPFDIWALPESMKNEQGLGQKIIQICDTFQSIYQIGPAQKFRLSEVLMDQYKRRNFSAPSLSDIATGYAKARGAASADTIDSILNQFKLTGAFLPDHNLPDIPSMHDYLTSGRKIFNFQLDLIASPEIIRFYATVILNDYNQLMMSQPNQTSFPSGFRNIRSLLVIDEAHNLMQHRPKSLGTIQSMGRAKGFGLLMASQQLKHFQPDPRVNYANLMDTWVLFSSAGLTKADLNGVGAGPDASQALLAAINQLGQGQAAFLTLDHKNGDWGSARQYWRRKEGLD
jgi:DNA phosphorothioation-dependent restriction protein DptH